MHKLIEESNVKITKGLSHQISLTLHQTFRSRILHNKYFYRLIASHHRFLKINVLEIQAQKVFKINAWRIPSCPVPRSRLKAGFPRALPGWYFGVMYVHVDSRPFGKTSRGGLNVRVRGREGEERGKS